MNVRLVIDVEGEENAAVQFPRLEVRAIDLDSKVSRKQALGQLDDLLEALERTNLNERRHPPPEVVRRLIEAGLPNPLSFSVPYLIEIIFNSQWPIMRANADGYSLL